MASDLFIREVDKFIHLQEVIVVCQVVGPNAM